MQLYQTEDMESAIKRMVSRNDRCVVFQKNWCLRQIRLKTLDVFDIPSIACRSWDSFADISLEKWQKEHNLLYYRHDTFRDKLPAADAMLYIEVPLQHKVYDQFSSRVGRETIIYRPPDWSMQEEALNFRYPNSAYYRTVLAAIEGLRGNARTDRQEMALRYSGFDPAKTTVFTADDIMAITGIGERLLRILLSYKFKGKYIRYHCYTPQIEPDEPDMLDMYRILEGEPDVGRGMRMLRFDELCRIFERNGIANRVPGFKPYLKRLVREAYVSSSPPVYLMTDGWRKPDYHVIDAVANVRRGDWFRMMNLVEAAPEYDIYSPISI